MSKLLMKTNTNRNTRISVSTLDKDVSWHVGFGLPRVNPNKPTCDTDMDTGPGTHRHRH